MPAALLAGWALVRGLLDQNPSAGLGYAALLAGVLVVVLVVTRLSPEEREWFLRALIAVGAGVAVTGWIGVALRQQPWGHPDAGLWRAASAITYENATAGLLVPTALLALGACARAGHPVERRSFSALAALLLAGTGATLSRGGALALAVGLLVLVALLRRSAARLLPPLVGAALAFAALLPSIPVNSAPRPLLALAGLVLGLAVASVRPRIAATIGLVVSALLTGALALGVVTTAPEHWFTAAGTRLSPWSTERVEQVRAALLMWADDPVLGVGPGSPLLQWQSAEGTTLIARYVHNEYVQVLLELGVVGALLLVLLLSALLRRLWDAGPGVRRDAVASGAFGGFCAFLVHSGTDFLWHVPVVPLCVAATVAAAMRREEQQ